MVKDCFINSRKTDAIYLGVGKSNCLTYIPEDIKLELDPLNASITGSLTISNGVVSGFNNSNYLTTPNRTFPASSAGSWEWVFKFKTGSDITTQQKIYSQGKSYPSGLMIISSKLVLHISTSDSSYNIAILTGSYTLAVSRDYWGKATFDGSAYRLYISTDGSSFTQIASVSSSSKMANTGNWAIGHDTKDTNRYMLGSIDLSQSYIKVNGSIWWQGGTGAFSVLKNSKIYIPNGYEADGTTLKFDEVIVANDTPSSVAFADNSKMWAVYYGKRLIAAVDTFSSSTTPTDLTGYHYDMFYNTTENKCYYCIQVDGVWKWEQVSLPLGLVTRTKASGYTAITQTFNGFGYIGSTVYALPGIKALIPDGFNEDGTYKSIEVELDKVLIDSGFGSLHTFFIMNKNNLESTADSMLTSSTLPTAGAKYERCYVTSENQWYYHTAGSSNWVKTSLVPCGSMSQSDGQITSLTPREIQYNNQVLEVKQVYKGSQLIWGYDPSEVIFQSSTPGTYTVDIVTSGYYNVAVVGGGSGGAYVYSSKFSDGRASGGSGAGFVGIIYLTAGSHTIKVGAGGSGKAYETNGQSSATSTAGGQSAIDSIIVANGGGSAKARIHGATQTAGSGGTLSYDSSKVQSYSLAKNGNAGTTIYNSNITGGASVYGGYGKGGNAGNSYTTSGSNGYVLISAV